jgi:hypothetical protein
MNTLNDLRHTLDEQAERVTDEDAIVRTTAVRHRVAVVRRRRRATGAGVLSLALVAGGAAALWDHGRADAAPTVLGVPAPSTMSSLSYTYAADGWSATVAGRGSVKLPASNHPRLISWTLEGATSVRFVLPNGEIWHSKATRFRDFVALPAGQSGTLSVAAGHGKVGLATYALTDQAPPGYTKDGLTFRESVASTPLLGAVIGDLGQTDAGTSYVVPRGQASVTLVCSGLPKGDAVHVSINGHERLGGDCNGSEMFDPGAATSYQFHTSHPGRAVVLRVYATDGIKSPTPLAAGSAPNLRIGVGVYGPVETRGLGEAALRADAYVEQDGHLWAEAWHGSSSNGEDVRAPGQSFGPSDFQGPVEAVWNTKGETQVSFTAQGMPTAGGRFPAGPGLIGDLWVPRGAVVHMGLDKGRGPIGVAFYRRAD